MSTARLLSVEDTAEAIRVFDYSHGGYARQAAAELVIRHDSWLRRPGFRELIEVGDDGAVIDWRRIGGDLHLATHGDVDCPEWLIGGTGSQTRVLEIACSLVTSREINLAAAISGLDSTNIALVARAVLHAAGRREGALVATCTEGGPMPVPMRTSKGEVLWDPKTAQPAPSVWDVPDVTGLAAITEWDHAWERIMRRRGGDREWDVTVTDRRTPANVRDTGGETIGRDEYAAHLDQMTYRHQDEPRLPLLKDGEAAAVAALLEVLAGLLPGEELGRTAREFAVRIHDRREV
jgi:hypothetical protein